MTSEENKRIDELEDSLVATNIAQSLLVTIYIETNLDSQKIRLEKCTSCLRKFLESHLGHSNHGKDPIKLSANVNL